MSQRIGAYRIERRLGAGGMGEVFLAWDERLRRHVAVKRLRHDIGISAERRQRLRREARAVAALHHPAIVQIFDLLEDDDGDSLVMEYVEGETLARRMSEGEVDPVLAVDVARQVAEGLAKAHGKGIVHRDLKAENVMLTPEGQAKILDFGLVKELGPERTGEDSLTRDGAVLGTVRAMSPEQAGGGEVDERSDLYSLGVLLYEMLTGSSPFRGENALQIHRKVLNEPPVPPRLLRPELPAKLGGLVEELLEKDPSRRPPSARRVAEVLERAAALPELAELGPASQTAPASLPSDAPTAEDVPWRARPAPSTVSSSVPAVSGAPRPGRIWVLGAGILFLALGSAAVFWWRPSGWNVATVEPVYVAVGEPRIQESPGQESALVAAAVEAAILDGLLSLEGIVPLTPDEIEPAPDSVTELIRVLAAGEAVTSRLECERHVCQVVLRRQAERDRRVLGVTSFQIPTHDFSLLGDAVVSHVAEIYPRHRRRSGSGPAGGRSADYEDLLRLLLAYENRDLEQDEVIAGLAALRRRAPGFVDVLVAEAFVRYERYFYSREPADQERVFELLEEAVRLEPGHLRALLRLSTVAVETGRLDLAAEAIGALERLEPGDARVLARRALLLERRGEPREALSTLRTAAGRWPSWIALIDLAHMEYRQGEVDAARQTLESLLRTFPEHFDARSFLAQLELLEGSPARAEELYRELVERSPGIAELANLGLAQLLQGRYREARDSTRRASDLAPDNPALLLNLADAEYLSGARESAEGLYRRVVELTSTGDSVEWQQWTVHAQALAHLGRSREAVAAVERALQLSPQNLQAAYEAALVFGLTGEHARALAQAERALAALDVRWFALPWFDELRDDPRWHELLEGR